MQSLNITMQPFFEWLLRSTIQASMLICLIFLFQMMLRSKLGSRWCHAFWLILLVRMVMPWAPQSRISIFNLIPQPVPFSRAEYAQVELIDETSRSAVTNDTRSVPITTEPQGTPKTPIETAATSKEEPSGLKPPFFDVANLLPVIWLAGAAVLAVYVCANNFALLRIVRRERPLTDQRILDLLEDCKAEMGIRTILGVVPTDKVKSASLFGFVRPRLLLPKGMLEALSREELRYVFLHELAHLKRHDIYLGWLTSILQVLHWFNPLIWLAFYRIRADRELACDALVLARLTSGGLARTRADESKNYGRTIVSLIERFSQPRQLPALAGILETKTQLKRRITMIAQFKKSSYRWSPLAVALIIILGCVSLPDAKRTKAAEGRAAKLAPGVTLRQVILGSGRAIFASLSPDGKYICGADMTTGDLAVYELATGKERRLTNKGSWTESFDFAQYSAISPDSKRVAFQWFNSKDGNDLQSYDLNIIGLDGSGQHVLRRGNYIIPMDWSLDSKQILAMLYKKNEKADIKQMIWVSTDDGSMRMVKTLGKPLFKYPETFVDLSQDGRYIAYDIPQEEGSSKRDIFLFVIDGNREVSLVQYPANDKLLGWTPDGKSVLFTSDRFGTWDAFLQQVEDGKPKAFPELVKQNMGDIVPIGFTPSGSFYYATGIQTHEVFVVELDLQTGKVLSPPRPVQHTGTTDDALPDWSRDGQYLAYCSRQKEDKSQTIHIRFMKTGEDRTVNAKLPYFNWLRWCPDGRSLLVPLEGGIFRIDAKTGECTTLLQTKDEPIWQAELSPDGETLFFRRGERGRLFVRDLKSDQEKQFFEIPVSYGYERWTLSPDGRCLAFSFQDPMYSILKIIPTVGGEPKDLLRIHKTETETYPINSIAWTPDGKHILFAKEKEMWRISTEGGEPQKLWEWEKSFGRSVRIHPDGRSIVFEAERDTYEIWVMENFLPAGK